MYAIAGGVLIAAILLLTTIWVSNSARAGTKQAVGKVSEFYLEELAGRLSRRADGSPINFVGLFVDIDDEKKLEETLEKQIYVISSG